MQRIQLTIELHSIMFSVIAAYILLVRGTNYKKAKRILTGALFLNILILLSDIGDMMFNGKQTALARFAAPFCNFTLYFFQILMVLVIGLYIQAKLEYYDPQISNRWLRSIFILQGASMILLCLTPFFGLYYYFVDNVYTRGPLFIVCIAMSIVAGSVTTFFVYRNRRCMDTIEFLSLVSYFVFPMAGAILQVVLPGMSYINMGLALSVLMVIFAYEMQDARIRKSQLQRLLQGRAYLLQSQIKPHFLFNCLSVIQSLVEDEPDTAIEAISHFSKFLRKNLDLRVSEEPISIWEELDFTNNYLYMEQLRFGRKLKIDYHIDEELEFMVPFLSLQPIVENAIRHGVRKKLEGGTVTIRIYEDSKWNVVQIEDDGVGFDPKTVDKQPKDKQSNGVGVKNVEERVKLLCNGNMKVDSAPGKGTRITLRFPKE